jgi:hypothetical protein
MGRARPCVARRGGRACFVWIREGQKLQCAHRWQRQTQPGSSMEALKCLWSLVSAL